MDTLAEIDTREAGLVWLAERSSLEIALEIQTGGAGESTEDSSAKDWIVGELDRATAGWDERHDAAQLAYAAGDPEPAVLLGHDIRSLIESLIRLGALRRPARDRNAEILRSFESERRAAPAPHLADRVITVAPRTAPRARGAGRPAARRPAAASRSSGSDDSGLADLPCPGRPGRRLDYLITLFRAWRCRK